MKKIIIFMAFTLILGLCYGCQTTEQPPETYVPTEENLTPILQQIVEPQLEVYREALGLPDLQIEFQVTKFEVAYRTIEFRVRDLLVSEALTKEIDQAILNNSMDTQRLEALSDIRFEYLDSDILIGEYQAIGISRLAYPILKTTHNHEYVLGGNIILDSDTVVYIAPNTEFDEKAHIYLGANINQSFEDMLRAYGIDPNTTHDNDIYFPAATCPKCGTGFRENTSYAGMILRHGYCGFGRCGKD